jgi:hypothetical protein
MFKKLSIIGSFALLAACSSNFGPDKPISDNYVDDVVIQKNSFETYIQIVGKEIIPIDLIENNLNLKVSILDVVVNVSNDSSQPVESVVNFDIQYSELKSENAEYSLVTISDNQIALDTISDWRDCDNENCIVTQSFSFSIATELLQNSEQHGVKFLLQQNDNSALQLETMIPGRYLTALFAQ